MNTRARANAHQAWVAGSAVVVSNELKNCVNVDGTEAQLQHLRTLVASCLDRGCVASALFFADKLMTLSNHSVDDIHTFASVLQRAGQARRAVRILRGGAVAMTILESGRFRYLLGSCLADVQLWDEALLALAEDDEAAIRIADSFNHNEEGQRSGKFAVPVALRIDAAYCSLRGKIYEALENAVTSTKWYLSALRRDARCYDSFERIMRNRILTREQESELIQSLDFRSTGVAWLKDIYVAMLDQHYLTSDASYTVAVENLANAGLESNPDVLAAKSQYFYTRNRFQQAREHCKAALDRDPFNEIALPVYICTLVELKDKHALFYLAHQLVELQPSRAIVWFAVGSYYYVIRRFDVARRYFSKATTICPQCLPAWIGIGLAFSCQEESDQAMAAFRTADRLFKGTHIPKLFLGTEYLKIHNMKTAESFLQQSLAACSTDPLVYNELGCVYFSIGNFQDAIDAFLKVLELVSPEEQASWEATYCNLGHSYRKVANYRKALEYYYTALSIAPNQASTLSAIGFTYHLRGKLDDAVEQYHKALGIDPSDSFTADALSRALEELFGHCDSRGRIEFPDCGNTDN